MAPPVPLSPMPKGQAPSNSRTSSTDSASGEPRKRVCKACDRCRLKKSKCDGSHPCTRCKADNSICVFGERKKSHDKVYPKGYVEMLEQQQSQLVNGLQEMYRRSLAGMAWEGQRLRETNGHPLTHDILAALGLLVSRHDGSEEAETFEEDCSKLQSRFPGEASSAHNRRESFSSDSNHSQHDQTSRDTKPDPPALAPLRPQAFHDKYSYQSANPSSVPSPASPQRQSFPPAQPSSIHNSPLSQDPSFYQAEWAQAIQAANQQFQSRFTMQQPPAPHHQHQQQNHRYDFSTQMQQQPHQQQHHQQQQEQQQHMNSTFFHQRHQQPPAPTMDLPEWQTHQFSFNNFNSSNDGAGAGFPEQQQQQQHLQPGGIDYMLDPMDVDFAKFIQVQN